MKLLKDTAEFVLMHIYIVRQSDVDETPQGHSRVCFDAYLYFQTEGCR
jgi:hypothetical protein